MKKKKNAATNSEIQKDSDRYQWKKKESRICVRNIREKGVRLATIRLGSLPTTQLDSRGMRIPFWCAFKIKACLNEGKSPWQRMNEWRRRYAFASHFVYRISDRLCLVYDMCSIQHSTLITKCCLIEMVWISVCGFLSHGGCYRILYEFFFLFVL